MSRVLTDSYGKPRSDYTDRLQAMTDDELVGEVKDKVWLSGYAANNSRSDYHWKCDATYDECRRRAKPWLYQRGWNAAYRLAGHEPSESDVAAAREPSEAKP